MVLCRCSAVVSGWRVAVLPDVLGGHRFRLRRAASFPGCGGRGGWSGGCWQGA